jgi:hypothetical protein
MPGPVSFEVVDELERNRFDQAPVFDPDARRLWGLVETKDLKSLLGQQAELAADDPVIRRGEIEFRMENFATVNDLFVRMTKNRAVIVIAESGTKGDSHNDPIYGLFTISDLNRHGVRGIVYLLLCTVEAGLARLVECSRIQFKKTFLEGYRKYPGLATSGHASRSSACSQPR